MTICCVRPKRSRCNDLVFIADARSAPVDALLVETGLTSAMLALLTAALAVARAAASTLAAESVTDGAGPDAVLLLSDPHPAMRNAAMPATKLRVSASCLFPLVSRKLEPAAAGAARSLHCDRSK